MTESGKRAVIPVPNYIKVLIGISHKLGDGNIKQISDMMELSYSTVSRLISRFENQEKWVKIKRNNFNPANNKVKLTAKGHKVLSYAEQMLHEMGIDVTKRNFIKKVNDKK